MSGGVNRSGSSKGCNSLFHKVSIVRGEEGTDGGSKGENGSEAISENSGKRRVNKSQQQESRTRCREVMLPWGKVGKPR